MIAAVKFPVTPKMLDMVERVLVSALYAMFCARFVIEFFKTRNPITPLLMLSEGLVVGFLLFRRNSDTISTRPRDWLLAVGGTCVPLLVSSGGGTAVVPGVLSLLLLLSGDVIQIAAKLTLRRGFGIVAANRGVKIEGPYRAIRHPMYAGYMVSYIGFFLSNVSVWNVMVYCAAFTLLIMRVLAEERLLFRDTAYRNFAAAVPYRLVPGLF